VHALLSVASPNRLAPSPCRFAGVNLSEADFPAGWRWLYKADGFAHALRLFMLGMYEPCNTPGCPTLTIVQDGVPTVVYKHAWAAARLGLSYDDRWQALGVLLAIMAGAHVLCVFFWARFNHASR